MRLLQKIKNLLNMPKRLFYSTPQSYTAECGEGFTGSKTVTMPERYSTSKKSLTDANNKAYLEAKRRAIAELVCTPIAVEPPPVVDPPPPVEEPPVVTPPAETWYKWANEWDTVVVPENTKVRYGFGDKWVERVMSGTIAVTNDTFGDPIYGTPKILEATIQKPVTSEPPPPVVVNPPVEPPPVVVDPIPVPNPPTTERVVLNMADYGIKLSDTNNSIDTDIKLKQLMADISGPNKPAFTVVAPAGGGTLFYGEESLSLFTKAHNVIFDGNGCKLQPLSKYAWQGAAFTFNSFYKRHTGKYVYAPRFKTVKAGDYRIPLETAADASMFHVGQRILPMGRELQRYGYPPNLAFYEWHVVKSVGHGFVDIEIQLEYSFNEKWQDTINYTGDVGFNVGKPRIWLLDVPSEDYYWTKFIKFMNFEVLHNPQSAAHWGFPHASNLFWEGEHVEIENTITNIHCPLWPTQSKYTLIKDATVHRDIEIDKVCGTVEIIGGKSGGISGATGCKQLIIKNHEHPFCNTSALKEHWEGNTFKTDFYSALQPQPEGMHTRQVVLKDNIFDISGILDGAVHRTTIHKLLIGTDKNNITITTDGNYLYMAETEQSKGMHKGWIPDILFFNWGCTQVYKIVDVEWENEKWKLITTAPAGTFKDGQEWYWERGNIKESGNKILQWGKPVLGGDDMRWAGNTVGLTGKRTVRWTEDHFRWIAGGGFRSVALWGMIDSITVNVTKAYQGGYNIIGFFKNDWGHQEQNRLLNINMKQVGTRVLKPSGGTGLKEGDYFDASKLPGFFSDISYSNHTDIQIGGQRPEFEYLIEFRPYEGV